MENTFHIEHLHQKLLLRVLGVNRAAFGTGLGSV